MQVTFETVGLALVLALVIGLVAGFRGGRSTTSSCGRTDAGLAFPPLVLALGRRGRARQLDERHGPRPGHRLRPGVRPLHPGPDPRHQGGVIRRGVDVDRHAPDPHRRRAGAPQRLTGLVVAVAIALGSALLAESGLAFLGLGPPPPAASWGAMLQEAYDTSLFTHPWSLVPAGLTIALTVLAFNTIGDALRDTVSGSATTNRTRGQRARQPPTRPHRRGARHDRLERHRCRHAQPGTIAGAPRGP